MLAGEGQWSGAMTLLKDWCRWVDGIVVEYCFWFVFVGDVPVFPVWLQVRVRHKWDTRFPRNG